MSRLQDVFNRTLDTNKEIKEIKSMYKDALANSASYQRAVDEIKLLKERKKTLEENIKEEFSSEFDKLDTLKVDLENDKQLLADISINKVAKGEKIEVEDEHEVKKTPVFSVKFENA